MIQKKIVIKTHGKGLYPITDEVQEALAGQLPETGMLNCFIAHTSASLLIQENFDPTAKADMEEFFDRLVPENQAWHRHTAEGPDDTTSHLKAALTTASLMVPISEGKLALGTWQGIYLFEHRFIEHSRKILLTVIS